MPSAVRLREDYSANELRTLARRSKDVSQSRRLLSLAAVRDGMDRAAAAKIGGMDRQTLRDWVHRFNASGPEGLIDNRTEGPKPRLSEEQLAQFAMTCLIGVWVTKSRLLGPNDGPLGVAVAACASLFGRLQEPESSLRRQSDCEAGLRFSRFAW